MLQGAAILYSSWRLTRIVAFQQLGRAGNESHFPQQAQDRFLPLGNVGNRFCSDKSPIP